MNRLSLLLAVAATPLSAFVLPEGPWEHHWAVIVAGHRAAADTWFTLVTGEKRWFARRGTDADADADADEGAGTRGVGWWGGAPVAKGKVPPPPCK